MAKSRGPYSEALYVRTSYTKTVISVLFDLLLIIRELDRTEQYREQYARCYDHTRKDKLRKRYVSYKSTYKYKCCDLAQSHKHIYRILSDLRYPCRCKYHIDERLLKPSHYPAVPLSSAP